MLAEQQVSIIAAFWTATNQPYRQSYVTTYKNTPAIVGWNIGDDVNWPPVTPRYTPAALAARHEEIKGYSSAQLT